MKKKSFVRVMAFILIGVFMAMVYDGYNKNFEGERIEKNKVISTLEKKKGSIFLGQGKSVTNISLEVYESNYYVAYNNKENIVLLELDAYGNKKNNISIKEKSNNIRDINVLNNQGNLYLTYIINDKDYSNFKAIKLDGHLNHLSIDEIENINSSCKVSGNLLALSNENRLSIINLTTNELEYAVDDVSIKEIKSVKSEQGEMLVYSTMEGNYYYLIYNDTFQEPKLILNTGTLLGSYESMEVAFNNNDIYLIFEGVVLSEDKGNHVFRYSINDEKVIENNELAFNDNKKLGDVSPYFEQNKLQLIGEIEEENNTFCIGKIDVGDDYSVKLEEEISSGSKGYDCIKRKDNLIIYAERLNEQIFNINIFLN